MNKENGIKRLNRLSAQAKEYRDENTRVVKLSTAIEVIELLDEPKPLTEDQAWKVIADVYNQDADRWEDAKNHYLNSLKEKPVVKQFVADWFEESVDLEDDLYELIGETYTSNDERTEMQEFILSVDINPIETLIKMKLYGYEVVKEPQWFVRLGNSYLYEPMADISSDGLIRLTRNRSNAYPFESKEMADIHIDKFGGEAEEVSK